MNYCSKAVMYFCYGHWGAFIKYL